MSKKKKILTVLWIIIAVIAVASITTLFVFSYWKGLYFAVCGGFLILNILISMFFIKKNFRD
jgi:uncharacterized membrane protein